MPSGNTFNEYTGDGSTVDFTYTFPTLKDEHVIVNVNGTDYDKDDAVFNLNTGPTRVTFIIAPASGATVRVYRNTMGKDNDDTDAIVTFADGSIITEDSLNKAVLQSLYIAQEKADFETDLADSANGAVLVYNSTTGKWEVLPINLQYDSTNGTFGFGGTPATDYAHKFYGDFLVRQDGTSNGAVLTIENTDPTNTNAVLILASKSPIIQMYDTDGSTDKKYFNIYHQDGTITFQPLDDLGAAKATIPLKLVEDGGVLMPSLPTSDPSVTGEVWNSNGFLMYTGSEAIINTLGDVDTSGVAAGKFLKYNGVSTNWEAGDIDDLNEIGNVSAPGPSNKDILEYDGSEWVNRSRYVYDSGWVTQWGSTTLAANTFDSVTMTAAVGGYFPFEVRIWGRLASSPNEVYPLDSAVAQSSASGTTGVQVKYNESTRDLTLYFQDVPVWHEVTSGIGSTLLWGTGIDEIRVTINR